MILICLSPIGHLILTCINKNQSYFLRLSIISLVAITLLIIYTYFYGKYNKQLKSKSPKVKNIVLENGKSISIPKSWTLSESNNLSYICNESNKVAIFQSKNIIDYNNIFADLKENIECNVLSDNYKFLEILSVEKIANNIFKGEVKVSVNGKIKCMNYFILDNMQYFATNLVDEELLLDIILSYE